MEKILVVCAHPDDEVLGCGGTLLKHKKKKDEINLLYVFEGSSGRYQGKDKHILSAKDKKKRKQSAIKVGKFLNAKTVNFFDYENLNCNSDIKNNISKNLSSLIKKINPTIIYTHSSKDLNIDHRTCNECVLVSTRPTRETKLKKLLAFEIPSSTEWALNSFLSFSPSYFVNIEKFIKSKLKILKYYDYEMKKFPHPRSNKIILAQSELSGSIVGVKNAEKFEVIKIIE